MLDDFAVFILTHGRADNVITYDTLRKQGYTGKIYLVIDNMDKTADAYYQKYGDEVLMFNKEEIAKKVDHGDNFNDLRTTTHVRNAIFYLAEQVGKKYFLALDDDYTTFVYRINQNKEYPKGSFLARKTLNEVFSTTLDFFKSVPTISSICFSQGGDWFGGESNQMANGYKLKRKAMNSFFCSTDRRFWFISRMNEDVNTYLTLGSVGKLFFTTPLFSLDQVPTQASTGGMTETYIDNGTYIKSFFTVMYCPSFVKVSQMGRTHKRIHYTVKWNNATPMIISEEYKK